MSENININNNNNNVKTVNSFINSNLFQAESRLISEPVIQHNRDLTTLKMLNERSWELHYPGYKYMGPGTHVVERARQGIKPTNWLDEISYRHDLAYIKANGDLDRIREADVQMLKEIGEQAPQHEGPWLAKQIARLGISAKILVNPMLYNKLSAKLTPESLEFIKAIETQNRVDIETALDKYNDDKQAEKDMDKWIKINIPGANPL